MNNVNVFRFQNEFTDTRTATLKASFLEKRISDSQSNRMTLTIWVHCIDDNDFPLFQFYRVSPFSMAGVARTRQVKSALPPSHLCTTRIQTERWYATTCPTTKHLVALNTGVRYNYHQTFFALLRTRFSSTSGFLFGISGAAHHVARRNIITSSRHKKRFTISRLWRRNRTVRVSQWNNFPFFLFLIFFCLW